ncbi:MAG: hypothetical protein ACRD5L_11140, partial [Bryobacteraceae bacterium]
AIPEAGGPAIPSPKSACGGKQPKSAVASNVNTPVAQTIPPANLASAGSAPAVAAIAQVNREVGTSLDDLKDAIFRLELRRQAGTISEEDYAAQRAKAEKIIRDLVRG